MTHHSPLIPRFLQTLLICVILATNGYCQTETEQRQFQEAERYYEAGKAHTDPYEVGRYMTYVIGLYNNYLNTYPKSPNAPAAWFHLGHAQQTLGKIDECRRSYRTMIERFRRGPYVGSAARQMAYLAYVEEDWAEAAKYFGITADHLSQDSLRHNALTKQVQCLLKLNRSEEVTEVLKKIIDSKNHPYRDWARFMLGYQYYESDKFQTAINVFEPLLDVQTASKYRSQALFYTGLVMIAFSMSVWNHILRTLRSYEASILGASTVIWTALLAVPILGETLTINKIIGIALMLVGLALVQVMQGHIRLSFRQK